MSTASRRCSMSPHETNEHMPTIPKHIIEDLKERVNIVEVIGRYVPLKRAGRSHKGVCPFHSESAPSFNVSEDQGFFHCFGCGESGDVIRFLMLIENQSFYETVKQLADDTGFELPEQKPLDATQKQALSEKERLLELNVLASQHFQKQLIEHPTRKLVLDYLEKRGVNRDMIEKFRLGFAPESWDLLLKALEKKGYSSHAIERAGLAALSRRGSHIDLFRNRLMFPIIMQHERVVGFGGRILGDEQNYKYINSPDTPIYTKSQCLYGYHQARQMIRRNDQAIVVEGNLDVVMMHQFGFENTVATLGTALTEEHLKLLKRMTSNLVMLYDGDAAGRKAMFKSLPLFLAEKINARAVVLPDPHDPDSFLKENNAAAMTELLNNARYLFDIWLEHQYPDSDVGPREKADSLHGIIPMLAKIADPVEKTLYVQKIAGRLGVGQSMVAQLLRQHLTNRNWDSRVSDAALRMQTHRSVDGGEMAQVWIVALLLLHGDKLAPVFSSRQGLDGMSVQSLKRLAERILDSLDEGDQFSPDTLLQQVDDLEWKNLVAKILINEEDMEESVALQTLEDCLTKLEVRSIEQKILTLRMKIQDRTQSKEEERNQIALQLIDLNRKLQELKTSTIH